MQPQGDSEQVQFPSTILPILGGAAVGSLIILFAAPQWLPDLVDSLLGPDPKAYWYLSRASGIVAYVLLWISVALGLSITSKLARVWPSGPTAVELHQFTGLLALVFAVFHAVVLLGDTYIQFTIIDLIVPFAGAEYRPLWVGVGQLGFYLGLLIAGSFYIRKQIGPRSWRLIHYASFGVYLAVTVHGFAAGTDAKNPAMLSLYGVTGGVIYFLLVYRVLVSRPRSHRRAPEGRREPQANRRPASGG